MKKFITKQKNCLMTLIGLVVLAETLLKIDNKLMQSVGILLMPFIAACVYFVIRNDQKKEEN